MSDNQEHVNFYKMILLMTDIGTKILLDKFYQLVGLFNTDVGLPNTDVKSFFMKKKLEIDEKRKKNKKFMDQVQYDQLYPTSSDPNPNNYDITLLVKLLSNLFSKDVEAPSSGWEKYPAEYDKNLGADLLRIRKIRNEIVGHSARACLSHEEFEELWLKVEVILKRIAKSLSEEKEKHFEKVIQKLKSSILFCVTDRDKKLRKVFSDWYKEDHERCQTQLNSMKESLDKLQEQMDSLIACTNVTDGRRYEMETKIMEQVNSLNDFANIASVEHLQEVHKKVESLHGRQENMYDIVKALQKEVANMTEKLRDQRSGDQFDGKDCQGLYATDYVPSHRGYPIINVRPSEFSTPSSSSTAVPNKKNDNNKYAVDDREIDKWSSMIGREWNQLRIYLDLTEEQNYQVEEMYPKNIKKRIFTMLKGWHDAVVQCGEDPKMLLAAAFVQADTNYEKAYRLVPRDKLDINLEARQQTKDCIKRIVFGQEGNSHSNSTNIIYKGGDGAINVFPGGTFHASESDVSLNSSSSSSLTSQDDESVMLQSHPVQQGTRGQAGSGKDLHGQQRLRHGAMGTNTYNPSNICRGENQDSIDAQKRRRTNVTHSSAGHELKKALDDTLCQSAMDNLTNAMRSVGAIVNGADYVGTVFRVGDRFVMTTARVLRIIVTDPLTNVDDEKRLISNNVYINFNESPIQLYGKVFRVKLPVCFYDENLDVAVLEIDNPFSLPKQLLLSHWIHPTLNLQKVAIIGFEHPKSTKKHLELCQILHSTHPRIKSALEYIDTHSEIYKSMLQFIGKDPNIVDNAYIEVFNDLKLILNCFLEHGASGAPLIATNTQSDISVIGVLTHGSPELYFCLSEDDKIRFPFQNRFELASKMEFVYKQMCNVDPNLAAACFGGN